MPESVLATPQGYLRLDEARDLIPDALAAIDDDSEGQGKRRSRNEPRALLLRKAILAGDVNVVARRRDGGLEPLNMRAFESLVQPAKGNVITFDFLRPGSHVWRLIPERMRAWLPSAELFIETASLRRLLQKLQMPRRRSGRPFRSDALAKAEELVRVGTWNPLTDRIGRLHQLLNVRGVLDKPISLQTTSRLAQEHLGYLPRRRSVA
jgi:hypothetical protein